LTTVSELRRPVIGPGTPACSWLRSLRLRVHKRLGPKGLSCSAAPAALRSLRSSFSSFPEAHASGERC
jgi:hypothetical protein